MCGLSMLAYKREIFIKAWLKKNTHIFVSVYCYWETSCWKTFKLRVNQHYQASPSWSELMYNS